MPLGRSGDGSSGDDRRARRRRNRANGRYRTLALEQTRGRPQVTLAVATSANAENPVVLGQTPTRATVATDESQQKASRTAQVSTAGATAEAGATGHIQGTRTAIEAEAAEAAAAAADAEAAAGTEAAADAEAGRSV